MYFCPDVCYLFQDEVSNCTFVSLLIFTHTFIKFKLYLYFACILPVFYLSFTCILQCKITITITITGLCLASQGALKVMSGSDGYWLADLADVSILITMMTLKVNN